MANPTDTSKSSGNWEDASTWKGGVPDSTDAVIIKNFVTENSDATVVSVDVEAGLNIAGATLTTSAGLTDNGLVTGQGTIASSVSGGGIVEAEGGKLDITGPVDASNDGLNLVVGAGADLKLDGAVGATDSLLDGTSSTTVDFVNNGALDLTGEGAGASGEMYKFQATVDNFAGGDKILVAGSAGDMVHFNAKTDVLTVTSGSTVEAVIQLDGQYAGDQFQLANSNGVDTITTNAICFMAGTMIRTPKGEVAVETLKRGDLVLTTDGVAKPVTWLGKQTISTVFADPKRVWPVRIKAGALGENLPARDLVVSPGHAMFIDGALILASALVNGSSIIRETTVPKVFTYYHVEVDDHSLIYAEGAPAETFVDNVDRLAFDNWSEHEALYPNGKTMVELPYPVAKSHRQVPVNIRVKLAERAQQIGAAAAYAVA
ncbi:MAG: Hint domain-containing protein [Candidatus Pacebacteria bacterium]|nr:Hint domain-containing protein [Candidatus Paceibacterota bacterium]